MEFCKRVAKRLAYLARVKYHRGVVDARDIDYREYCALVLVLTKLGFKVDRMIYEGFILITHTESTTKFPSDVYDIYYMLVPTEEQYYSIVVESQGASIRC